MIGYNVFIMANCMHVFLIQLWLLTLPLVFPSLIARQWVWPQTEWQFFLQSVREDLRLNIVSCLHAVGTIVVQFVDLISDCHWICPPALHVYRFHSLIFITKTCLYNFDPLKPHFYIVKLGFTEIYIIFVISAQKHRLWVLIRTASTRRF